MKNNLNRIVLTLSIIAGVLASSFIFTTAFNKSVSKFTPTGDPSVSKAAPKSLAEFYAQKPLWKDCTGSNSEARCGDIQVPLDWANPSAGAIKIAVAVNPATNPETAPYLLMNPGGPGGSGRDWITDYINSLGTSKLRKQYNLVGFDPRGVGASTAVKCFSTTDMYDYLYGSTDVEFGSAEDIAASKQSSKEFAAACKANTGALLGKVDTSSAAKDMDIIRAVLGETKLNFLGFSYGSMLGLTYASYFPKKVGRFVLDGVVDPTITPEQDSINQLKGFVSAMKAYLGDCIKNVSNCPFKGLTVDGAMNKIGRDYLGVLEGQEIDSSLGSRTLTLNSGFTGMIAALYSRDSWPYLTRAFNEFFSKSNQDTSVFLLLADSYNAYDMDSKTFDGNETEAFKAVNCLDARESSDPSAMAAQNKKVLAVNKVFGRYWQYGGLSCYGWPYKVVAHPKDYSAKGAPTMLIVGTTNDPATPYTQSVNVAHKVLDKARLLTYKGEGHTAYGRSNSCVANTVDDFFISGTLPSKDKNC